MRLLLMFLTAWAMASAVSQSVGQEYRPHGRFKGVSFDAILELTFPKAGNEVLFITYWVAPDRYCLRINWKEPIGLQSRLSIPPVGLNISSDREVFSIHHGALPWVTNIYKKPLGTRPPFTYRFTDYPLQNIRFAETETRRQGVGLTNANKASGDKTETERIASARGAFYSYLWNSSELVQEEVVLPEERIIGSLQRKPATVKLNGKAYQIMQFPLVYNEGGRRVQIDYAGFLHGEKELRFPSLMQVTRSEKTNVLRRARLSNFTEFACSEAEWIRMVQDLSAGPSDLSHALTQKDCTSGGLESAYRRCYQMLQCRPFPIRKANLAGSTLAELQSLKVELENLEQFDSAGITLQTLGTAAILNQVLSDQVGLRSTCRQYFRLLQECDLPDMLFLSGSALINQSIQNGDFLLCNLICDEWLKAMPETLDSTRLAALTEKELREERIWPTLRVIEHFKPKTVCANKTAFHLTALRAIALNRLLSATEGAASKNMGYAVFCGRERNSLLTEYVHSRDHALELWSAVSDRTLVETNLYRNLSKTSSPSSGRKR